MLKSVDDIESSTLFEAYGDAPLRLLAGCAPCQTFSSYNQKADSSDKRWWLLLQFSRLIQEVSPELVTMENVPGLKDQDVFTRFLTDLKKHDYHVNYQVVNCAEYGVQGNRMKLFCYKAECICHTLYGAINKARGMRYEYYRNYKEAVYYRTF